VKSFCIDETAMHAVTRMEGEVVKVGRRKYVEIWIVFRRLKGYDTWPESIV
jgi:hypothetical protein